MKTNEIKKPEKICKIARRLPMPNFVKRWPTQAAVTSIRFRVATNGVRNEK